MEKHPDLVIRNIGALATPLGNQAKSGKEQGNIQIIERAFVAIHDGKILCTGQDKNCEKTIDLSKTQVIDAQGGLVTPGLVDAHTHLVFSGWRQRELSLKLQGASYLEILAKGGGILYTVANTRKASFAELLAQGKRSLDIMLAHGTTTCEAKSGYGLNTRDELKSLKVIRELQRLHSVEIIPTFMGAHAVPPEFKDNKAAYVDCLCDEMIPLVAGQNQAEFCDVFCEDSVFNLEESRRILECGKCYGLVPKIHADEITALGGASLAGEMGAISAEHLIHASDEGLAVMAANGTIAVLLPGTSMYLNEDFARAAKMVEMGIPVAVATDFNPGSSPNESLQLPMNLACLKYRLRPEEVLTGVTLNAAAAINRAKLVGTLEAGKEADVVIWNASDLDYIFYHYGVNLVRSVIKSGKVVV